MKYSDAYWKISESFRQYSRDEPALNNNSNIIDFPDETKSNRTNRKRWHKRC